jgi:hypothetical protein
MRIGPGDEVIAGIDLCSPALATLPSSGARPTPTPEDWTLIPTRTPRD